MAAGGEADVPAAGPADGRVIGGRDYYFFIRLVEFTPRTPKGKPWDSDGSAPDALVKLTWRGNKMFSLPRRTDQLISSWDLFTVDVKTIITGGGTVDVSSIINGPIVNVAEGDRMTVAVYDNDVMGNELALKMDLDLAQLRPGRNEIAIPPGSGIVRLWIDMIDCATPLAELVNWQTGGAK